MVLSVLFAAASMDTAETNGIFEVHAKNNFGEPVFHFTKIVALIMLEAEQIRILFYRRFR